MSYEKVEALLRGRLNAITPSVATIFEGIAYKPVVGTPYQRVHFLWARASNPTLGDDFQRGSGIMQVMLNYPSGAGAVVATQRADLLIFSASGFKRGTALMDGTLRVLIDESPYPGPSNTDGPWYRLPVSIPFIADIYG